MRQRFSAALIAFLAMYSATAQAARRAGNIISVHAKAQTNSRSTSNAKSSKRRQSKFNGVRIPREIIAQGFRIDQIDLGAAEVEQHISQPGGLTADESLAQSRDRGSNTFSMRLKNETTSARLFFLSVRTEGTRNWQKGYTYKLSAGESRTISEEYVIFDRSCRYLKIYFGIPEKLKVKGEVDPKVEVFERLVFPANARKVYLDPVNRNFHFWIFDRTIGALKQKVSEAKGKKDQVSENARQELRELLKWNREAERDFDPKTIKTDKLDGTQIRIMQISGEPGIPIDFLLMRPVGISRPLKTILYLTGNPPGMKESAIAPMLSLVEAGFQVVSIDRRLSARHTTTGADFLKNIADPVFDARRLIDYLSTRKDVAPGGIAVIGFSQGAAEGQFLAALHDSVGAAVLVCRPIDNKYLFNSDAWWPTLYNPDILKDIGLGSLVGADFDKQLAALTPELNKQALEAFKKRYPYFDLYDSTHILPLAAPKPLLIVTGANDDQFPVAGVLALDEAVRQKYSSLGVEEAAALFIMPRRRHYYAPEAIDLTIDFLRLWM